MPVNIAPLVTPTYDAVISAPLDGEYANSAALQALVLPIANRTEYLKQALEDAPWRECTIMEDFLAPVHEIDADEFYADTAWVMNAAFSTYSKTPIVVVDSDDALGYFVASNATAGALSALVRKTEGCVVAKDVRRAAARVWVGSIAAGMGFSVGFDFVGGAPAVRAVFEPATSPNWLLQSDGGFVNQNTGIPVTAAAWTLLDLEHNGTGTWSLSVNGAAATTYAPASPVVTNPITPCWKLVTPAAGANRYFYVDFIYFRFLLQARAL